jgi:hypothetical protein
MIPDNPGFFVFLAIQLFMTDFDNTIKRSFSFSFCTHLEYHLTKAFEKAPQANKFEPVWCNGVQVPEAKDISMENFMATREIVTAAWLGYSGQDV